MEQEKLTNQKEALAFLCRKYPKCFFLEGPVKPLKIGIFQDLAADIGDCELVSKRLLRMSLRHYTSSWRYLGAVKAGTARIDLQGNEGEAVEEQHAEHASEQLKESKAKAAKYRENNPKSAKKPTTKHKGFAKTKTTVETQATSGAGNETKANANRKSKKKAPITRPAIEPPTQISDAEIKVGASALVKLGKEPMPVTISDIAKDGISVQLKSGMTVKVQQSQLFSSKKAVKK